MENRPSYQELVRALAKAIEQRDFAEKLISSGEDRDVEFYGNDPTDEPHYSCSNWCGPGCWCPRSDDPADILNRCED